jgi:pyruvate,water dikinase
MTQKYVYFFGEGQAAGGSELKHLVGGKGASLADMTRAGLDVPPGFTISAQCCSLYYENHKQWPAELDEEVRAALARLEKLAARTFGRGDNPLLVAVRSGAAQSMPGMMDTVLNVGRNPDGTEASDPWQLLANAINAVFDSWKSERAVAYRSHHHIEGLLGTAVTVQMMCPAEISGVMFTANPVSQAREQIVIEAAPGLGEAIVLGKVTPDRFVVDRRSLEIIESTLANPALPTLDLNRIQELARLGLRVEEHFRVPCDIEWSLADGRFFLLQERPIRGQDRVTSEAQEQVRREEIAALVAKAEPSGTVWSRYNLSEILPEPTPMTWALVTRMMSGRGGLGQMYCDFGFRPDPRLDHESVFDLVCGRPYCNLSREPLMYGRGLPYEHPFAALKATPQRALYPRPQLNFARAGAWFWLTLPLRWPLLLGRSMRSAFRMQGLGRTFAPRFRNEIVPAFLQATAADAARDLARLDTPALRGLFEGCAQRTLHDFARDSLKPTVLAALAMDNLERLLQRKLGPQRTRAVLGELTLGVHPDPDTDLPAALRDLAAGRLEPAAFCARFGHRGFQEMELAQPRWQEEEHALSRLVAGPVADQAAPPPDWKTTWDRIATEAQLSSLQRTVLTGEVESLRTYLALRETGKHYLLVGYAQLRRILLELDSRFQLGGGIFYLLPSELPRLSAGENLQQLIEERRRRRRIALSLEVPQVLFSDDLEAIGRPIPLASTEVLQGVALSSGVAEGEALVLTEPRAATLPAQPFILVCPTTDPAWMPLFVQARGLVMETGGVLSHGAIVAREFGLPAVAGLPEIHRRLRTGQRLRVDGGTGRVNLLA